MHVNILELPLCCQSAIYLICDRCSKVMGVGSKDCSLRQSTFSLNVQPHNSIPIEILSKQYEEASVYDKLNTRATIQLHNITLLRHIQLYIS